MRIFDTSKELEMTNAIENVTYKYISQKNFDARVKAHQKYVKQPLLWRLLNIKAEPLNLSGYYLGGIHLNNVNLNGAVFKHTVMPGAIEDCSFVGSNLENAEFGISTRHDRGYTKNCDFTGANLKSVDISYRNFERCNLSNANLQKAKIKLSVLNKCNLSSAQCEHIYLENSGILNAFVNEKGINLKHACLSDSQLANTNLENSDLSNMQCFTSILANMTIKNSRIDNAIIRSVRLKDLKLNNTTFIDTEFANIQDMNTMCTTGTFTEQQQLDMKIRY